MAQIYFDVKLIMSLQREENSVHIFACVSAKQHNNKIIRSVCTLKESNTTSLFQNIFNRCKMYHIFCMRKTVTWMRVYRGEVEKLKCRL